MTRDMVYFFLGFVLLGVIIALLIFKFWTLTAAPCEVLTGLPASSIPARCIPYFQGVR